MERRGGFINQKRVLSELLILSIVFSVFAHPLLINAKSSYRYATTTVNIRAKPSTKSQIIRQLYWNDKIKVIKKINKKWFLVSYKKKNRYVYAKYLKRNQSKYISYSSPSSNTFKSFEDADLITNSSKLAQGRLKNQYHLDYKTGLWMVGNRYCVAVGSFYTRKVGVKIDLVLSYKGKKYILKCITADSKADKDTINKHRIHKDGSIVEFVVKTSMLSSVVRKMGDVSYAGKKFKGKITQIRVYK